jgi:hypothetical protein
MNKSLRAVLAIFGFFALILALMSLSGYPLVCYPTADVGKNRTYPFNEFAFKEGAWEAYVILGWSDYKETVSEIRRKGGTVLRTKDSDLLLGLKKMNFRWQGEIGTPPSNTLLLTKNGKVVFSATIFLDYGYVGLQSSHYGLIVPENRKEFIRILSGFERVYSPLVLL